jgi:hypothetical protein
MIRRQFITEQGATDWLLVSQIEHAHLGAALARQWAAEDLSPHVCDGQLIADATADEILSAITHHDDGWLAWEAAPRIDPAHARPYSFLNEMPSGESLAIWDRSIAAARQIGPLAGWMVASHFSELLAAADHADNDRETAWLAATQNDSSMWLAEWRQASGANTPRVARRALRLLQACDLVSLWLCCECPVAADESVDRVEPFVLDWREDAIGPYRFTPQRCAEQLSKCANAFAEPNWIVTGTVWPFAAADIALAVEAWLAPAIQYQSTEELTQSRRPVTLHWRLRKSA